MIDTEQSLVLLIIARLKNPKYLSPTLGITGALLLFLAVLTPIMTFSSGFGLSTDSRIGADDNLRMTTSTTSILALVVAALCLLGYKKHIAVFATGSFILVIWFMLRNLIYNGRPTGVFDHPFVPGIPWWRLLLSLAGAILIIASGAIGSLSSQRAAKSSQQDAARISEVAVVRFNWLSNLWPCLGLAGVILLVVGSFAPIQLLHSKDNPMTTSWSLQEFSDSTNENFLEAGGWIAAMVLVLAGMSGFLVGHRRFYEVVAIGVCILGLLLTRLGVFIADYNVIVERITKVKRMNERLRQEMLNAELAEGVPAGMIFNESRLQHEGFIHWSISWSGWCILIVGACLIIVAGAGAIYSSRSKTMTPKPLVP